MLRTASAVNGEFGPRDRRRTGLAKSPQRKSELSDLQQIVTRYSPVKSGRGPQPIAEVLTRLMTRKGYANFQTSCEWTEAWRQVSGSQAAHSRTGKFNRGVLEVIVRNSTVLQELTFRKKHLMQALQERIPQISIKELRFRVGSIE
jgi:predicted nucleic acid-binding Zn ribbon protein